MILEIKTIKIDGQIDNKEITLEFESIEDALLVINGRNRVKELIGEEGDTEAKIIIEPEQKDGEKAIKESSPEGDTESKDNSQQKKKIREVIVQSPE